MKLRLKGMKWIAAACFAAGVAGTVLAGDGQEGFDRMLSRWRGERESLLRSVTQRWLTGEKAETMRPELMKLSQIESGLASSGTGNLYLGAVENPNDLNAVVGEVVRAYLKDKGCVVRTADFLRGRSFRVMATSAVGSEAK